MSKHISILMPVKNAAPYLKECLDSILNQTARHWELLAIDDHSTDNSYAILESYQQKDERVKVFKNEGKGIICGLRTAYKQAKGVYITRMDADDRMSLDKLALMSEKLDAQKNEHCLIVGLVRYFSENELGNGYLKYAEWLNHLSYTQRHFDEMYKECVIPSPCWMLTKTTLDRCGAFESNLYPEDYDLCFRFYRAGLQVIPVLEILHYWRDYPERTSRNDSHYLDNQFMELKVSYFLAIDYEQENYSLIIWGAGKKGKKLARLLLEQEIAFRWVCDNDKKIGKSIYGIKMEHFDTVTSTKNTQVLVTVAAAGGKAFIQSWEKKNAEIQCFYFC